MEQLGGAFLLAGDKPRHHILRKLASGLKLSWELGICLERATKMLMSFFNVISQLLIPKLVKALRKICLVVSPVPCKMNYR